MTQDTRTVNEVPKSNIVHSGRIGASEVRGRISSLSPEVAATVLPATSGYYLRSLRVGVSLSLVLVWVLALPHGIEAAENRVPGSERVVVFSPQPFPTDLMGWGHLGPALFAADTNKTCEGLVSARISVASDAELKYQQLRHEFTGDFQPNDEYQASVWVTTENGTKPPGAYLALEFLDRQGQRVGILHGYPRNAPGRGEWRRIETAGPAPVGTVSLRICLVLHAPGTAWFAAPEVLRLSREIPWPDLGDAVREIQIHPAEVLQPRFGGVGFHAFHHIFPASQAELDQVIYRRWRELNPAFVRVNHDSQWTAAQLDQVARHFQRMQETGAEIYLTTWSVPESTTAAGRRNYAHKVSDQLEYLVRQRGITNLHYYCIANELTMGDWGKLAQDLTQFRAYCQAFYDEFKERKLDIGLLATDASPVSYWWTVEWAAQNMDDITAVYGGHHYFSEHAPGDERFYPWFRDQLGGMTALARRKGKNFILGEFGSRQDGRTINGVKMDVCVYWDTPQEPLVALQLAEATVGMLNTGGYALAYWTFADLPDEYSPNYRNKWGVYKCSGSDRSTRSVYYGYGLLTKFLHGPATVVRVESNDPRVRAAAIRHQGTGSWSIVVVNRNLRRVPVGLALKGQSLAGDFRKYVYDPAHVPQHPFGDLPSAARVVSVQGGRLEDRVEAQSLAVYTTAYDCTPPAPVNGLQVIPVPGGRQQLKWQPNLEPDCCYYRVYRYAGDRFDPKSARQIGPTVATAFLDESPSDREPHYHIIAVDQSGNPSP